MNENFENELINEIKSIISVGRATYTPVDRLLNMPAARYDVYVELLDEMVRQEQIKQNEQTLRAKFR